MTGGEGTGGSGRIASSGGEQLVFRHILADERAMEVALPASVLHEACVHAA